MLNNIILLCQLNKRKFSYVFIFALFTRSIFADIVYLKDGTIYENVHILATSGGGIQFETASKEVQTFTTGRVLRLRYGDNIVEPINILLKDGTLIEGFLIEQDSRIVTIRRIKDSVNEENILKDNVKQMSANKIVVVYPEMDLRLGAFMPLNSGGSKLGVGFMGWLGFYITPPFLPKSKTGIEAGYVYIKSDTNKNMVMHLIPALVNFQYMINVSSKSSMEFNLAPRVGLGGAFLIFNDGEGGNFSSVLPAFGGGIGLYMTLVPKKLFLNTFVDYVGLLDSKGMLHSLMGSIAVQYRF
ncbi:MAG: hypothetical protein OEV78_07015 [Spirochaetia bacterium]|nr:hypothetical protein [Spirochaetia bacterium]